MAEGATATESQDRVIDQAIAEYEAYTAGKLHARIGKTDAPGGEVEYCGSEDDPAQWTIAYVRAADNAMVPLAVGDYARVLREFQRLDRSGAPFWIAAAYPPMAVLAHGHQHYFQPARGRVLLGLVELELRTVLLVASSDRLVAVHLAGGVPTTLPLGRPGAVREIDLDHWLDHYRPRAATRASAVDEPLRASEQTRADHIRVVHGLPVDLGDGPSIAEVLKAAFDDIEVRARAPKKRRRRKTLTGKRMAPYVLEYLRKMALRGSRDLVGLTGVILAEIQEAFPDFKITGEAFAEALKRIAATGTCLIAARRPRGRIWRINLAGLIDPTSALHRQLCRETSSRVRVDVDANQPTGGSSSSGRQSGAFGRAAKTGGPGRAPRRPAPAAGADADAATGKARDEAPRGPAPASGAAADSKCEAPRGPAPAAADVDAIAGEARREAPWGPAPAAGADADSTAVEAEVEAPWGRASSGGADVTVEAPQGPAPAAGPTTGAQEPAPTADASAARSDQGNEPPIDALALVEQLARNPLAGPTLRRLTLLAMQIATLPDAADEGTDGVARTEVSVADEPRSEGGDQVEPREVGERIAEVVARPSFQRCPCPWTPRSLPGWYAEFNAGHATRPARAEHPDPALLGHQEIPAVQLELRCRDIGTLGPRGPPARSGARPSRTSVAAWRLPRPKVDRRAATPDGWAVAAPARSRDRNNAASGGAVNGCRG